MEEQPINIQPIKTTPPKKSKKAKVTIIILAILLAAALGYGAYAWWQNNESQNKAAEQQSAAQTLKEENTALQERAVKAENERDTLAKEPKKPEEPAQPTDEQAVETAAQNFADTIVKKAGSSETHSIGQIKVNGIFATALVSSKGTEGGGGFGVILKKANGAWVVIHDGQNGPDKDTASRFGIPASL